jgi:membrane protease YdiL (CAAX protease family)
VIAEGHRRDPLLAAGLALAYGAFAHTFLGDRERFWQRMTSAGTVLGTLALVSERDLRRDIRIRKKDIGLGLAAAAGLYGVFQAGDRLARKLLPTGGDDIGEIYALDRLRPKPEIAARLALVIGPAEELFWRGFVQRRLQRTRLGRWKGAAAAAAAYGGAHVVTGNLTLTGAAGVAGAYWSALAAAGMPMGALIVSHVAWDVWIFLVAPTAPR